MNRKTTQSKKELVDAAIGGNERPERLSLAESRDKLYENFYHNIRVLVAFETTSMVEVARKLGLKSGSRITDLSYGRGTPSTEELMIMSKHFNCTIDDLLNKKVSIIWR